MDKQTPFFLNFAGMNGRRSMWLIFILLGFSIGESSAQHLNFYQSSFNPINSIGQLPPIKISTEEHSPKRATIMSAIIPGLGQIYNEKYWKVGIIYGAGFVMGLGMKYNSDSMRQYQRALNARVDTSSATIDTWYPLLTDAKVTGERDYYRRNRDMLILGFLGLYALQIIDANVDAHLKEFEINKDLALKIRPTMRPNLNGRLSTGMALSLRF